MSGTSFIPYQVDYTVQNTAKTLGFSKKRVTFKFGFANERALREGATGPACRGSEHELTFLWSLKSGKRQLLLDNRDLHFSESGQNGWTADRVWQHAFNLKDKATHKVFKVHFISQPKDRDLSDQRPFDLRIGGMSYFQFNKIFQLGTARMVAGQMQNRGGHASGRDSPMNAEERQQLAAAKLASLKDLEAEQLKQAAAIKQKQTLQAEKQDSMRREEEALISFDDDPPIPPVPAQIPVHGGGGAPTTNSQGMPTGYNASSITLDSTFGGIDGGGGGGTDSSSNLYGSSTNPYGAPPPAASTAGGYNNPYGSNPYGAPTTSSYDSYGTNPYGAPAPSSNSDPNSFALTPYQPAGGGGGQQQAQPYVDATGRVSLMQPQQQSGMSSAAAAPGSFGSSPYYNNQQQQPQPAAASMQSPSNQTYNSYGSAPSFAQPSQQPSYNSYGGSGAPSFAQPPQQQPYNSGYPPQAPSSSQQQQQQPYAYPPASYSYGS